MDGQPGEQHVRACDVDSGGCQVPRSPNVNIKWNFKRDFCPNLSFRTRRGVLKKNKKKTGGWTSDRHQNSQQDEAMGLRSEGLNNRTQSGRAGQRRRRRDLNSHRRRQAAHWATLFHFPYPPPELLWFVEGQAKMKRQGNFKFFSWSSFKKKTKKKDGAAC